MFLIPSRRRCTAFCSPEVAGSSTASRKALGEAPRRHDRSHRHHCTVPYPMIASRRSSQACFPHARSQDNAVFRRLFYEFRIIISSRLRAVTACNKEEMADRTCLYRVDNLISYRQDRSVSKASHHFRPAVDSCKLPVFRISAKLQRFRSPA